MLHAAYLMPHTGMKSAPSPKRSSIRDATLRISMCGLRRADRDSAEGLRSVHFAVSEVRRGDEANDLVAGDSVQRLGLHQDRLRNEAAAFIERIEARDQERIG